MRRWSAPCRTTSSAWARHHLTTPTGRPPRSSRRPYRLGQALCEAIVPLDAPRVPMVGSTDVGDVSWVVPTVQARGATYAIGTPGHSWQLTAQGKMPAAHKGMVHVAKVMAGTALDAKIG